MAVPLWPSDLPQQPQIKGYAQAGADGRLVSDTEVGPGKQRRRWTGAKAVQLSLLLKGDQLQSFWRFFDDASAGGALPFFFPDPVGDGAALTDDGYHHLTMDDGTGLEASAHWLVLFGSGAPSVTAVGGPWFEAAFAVQVLP